jgi:hypothetical protein
MDPATLLLHTKALLIRISVITGWVNPEGQLLNVLVDQFNKKLAESYQNVNPDEVEYAFRNYGTTVKDWGKTVNLSLIDEVMIAFLTARREVSAKEEQKTLPEPPAEPIEDLSDQAMTDWMAYVQDRVKACKCTVEFVPLALYEWKDSKGEITHTPEEKKMYIERAVSYRQQQLVEACDSDKTETSRKLLSELTTMREARRFTGDTAEHLKTLAKKMILFDILNPQP